ncbi:MAG TPA: hypothetical protein VG106_15330, partial [Vicinamibacterales bacterium]|nr:hypothetical protein [Vicinamibacterales bacterium]
PGCGAGEGLSVTGLQLGRALNADGTVAGHTTTFGPDDTVHVSVLTSGVGSATLSARWVYRDRVLDEPQKRVSYRDNAATAFTLRSGGTFPLGEYRVEVFLDGKAAGTREFRVDNPR